jgi:hypothetical protein
MVAYQDDDDKGHTPSLIKIMIRLGETFYHRTPLQDDRGHHYDMLQPYTITRRQGASSYDALCDFAMLYGGSIA